MEWLILWLGLAVASGVIASSKGRSGLGYFILGLLLPLIGVIIAIGVSSRVAPAPPQSSAPRRNEKKCPACAELILREAKKCKHCGEVLSPS
jgi:hypothetical protein